MSKNKHLGLLVDPETHYKLHYMAKYEGRSGNGEVLYLIRQAIREFEQCHGEIALPAQQDAPRG